MMRTEKFWEGQSSMKKFFILAILFLNSLPAFCLYSNEADILIRQNQQQMNMTRYYASRQINDEKVNIINTINRDNPKNDIIKTRKQMKVRMYGQKYKYVN